LKIHYLLPGRIIYAIAIAALGAICLVYVDFVNSLQPVPAGIPGYALLAVATGVFLVAAGLAILADYKVYPASIGVAGLFGLWIVLLHVPSAFTDPELLRSPWWIRTFESVALGGAALILAGMAGNPGNARLLRAGRIAFGVSLPVFGILHFIYPENVAALVALSPARFPWPIFWAYLTGAGHVAAGIGIATGVMARWAAILAGFMYASWALTLHLPRIIDNPATYSGDRRELTSLFVCVAFWGAAWIVAGSLAADRKPALGTAAESDPG
jgi:uncharacterized membrane protein YphA (DoxX/SURF4 family)